MGEDKHVLQLPCTTQSCLCRHRTPGPTYTLRVEKVTNIILLTNLGEWFYSQDLIWFRKINLACLIFNVLREKSEACHSLMNSLQSITWVHLKIKSRTWHLAKSLLKPWRQLSKSIVWPIMPWKIRHLLISLCLCHDSLFLDLWGISKTKRTSLSMWKKIFRIQRLTK